VCSRKAAQHRTNRNEGKPTPIPAISKEVLCFHPPDEQHRHPLLPTLEVYMVLPDI